MPKIAPCLWFDGQAEEAMNFYTAIFKNSKVGHVTRYGEAGPGESGSVMVARAANVTRVPSLATRVAEG